MHTRTLKWVSLSALLLAMVFWPASSSYQTELNLLVCVAAAVIGLQAYRSQKYRWTAMFLTVALVFNPMIPVFRLAGLGGLALVVFAIAPFAVSLAALRPTPLLSIPSITDRTPGSRAL